MNFKDSEGQDPEDGEGLGLAFGYSIMKFTKYSDIECGLENRTLASELGEQTPPVIGGELVDTFWFLLGPQLSHEQVGLQPQLCLIS